MPTRFVPCQSLERHLPLGHLVREQCCVDRDELVPYTELSTASGVRTLTRIRFEADFWIALASPARGDLCLCLDHVHVLYGQGLEQEQQQLDLDPPKQINNRIHIHKFTLLHTTEKFRKIKSTDVGKRCTVHYPV